MSSRQGALWGWSASVLVSGGSALAFAMAVVLGTPLEGVGLLDASAQAQAQTQTPPVKGKTTKSGRAKTQSRTAKGKAKANANEAANINAPQPKALPNAADPIAKAAAAAAKGKAVAEPVYYRLKLETPDDSTLVANYYPASPDTSTPVLLLIHEKGRSSKDFEVPLAELKGKGVAQHFQELGYAVLTFDLRGHGLNKRATLKKQDWLDMVYDLRVVYDFLLDRHNRGELNLAKLGVLALGEGANLTATWANTPEGAVSSEGRTTDLAALALFSPLEDWEGNSFVSQMKELGPRIRILLGSGERDSASKDAVQKSRDDLKKTRQNDVKFFPTLLHGYKLLQLEPGAIASVEAFFEATVKNKGTDWEPRYNMTPTPYDDIEQLKHTKANAALNPAAAPVAKEKEKVKAEAKPADADKPGANAEPKPESKEKG